MSDYEIERERIVEREVPVTERVVERRVPMGRRTVVEHRGGAGYGFGANPVGLVIVAAVVILLLLLILGAFT
jgi:hypothetical protein